MKKLNTLYVVTILVTLVAISCEFPKKITKTPDQTKVVFDPLKLVPLSVDTIIHYNIFGYIITSPKVEYYLSDSIVLERQISYKESDIGKEGKVLLKDIKTTETIVIPQYTIGECFDIDSTAGTMYLTFKKRGNRDAYIVFGPGSDKAGLYTLYTLSKGNIDSVRYGDYKYKVTYGKRTKLLFNPENISGNNTRIIEPGVSPIQKN